MKKLVSLFLAVIMIFAILPVSAFAAEAKAPASSRTYEIATQNAQARLNGKRTLTLGNAWTDVKVENNLLDADLTVSNYVTSAYSVCVRIISKDYKTIIKESKTIKSGYSATFSGIPSGGYVIQACSADGDQHEYTLGYKD